MTVLNRLLGTGDVQCFPGADAGLLGQLRSRIGRSLPDSHEQLLSASNGVEAYRGYFRILGLGSAAPRDVSLWNSEDYWKFAWNGRCDGYWCFGETAWGDQYAYDMAEVRSGAPPKVYFLDALSMTPEPIAANFEEFLEREFLRCATDPYDIMVKAALEKFGGLEPECHLVYIPSPLLGGGEDIGNVEKMNARASMVSNGDIAIQLDEGPADGSVGKVRPYEDDKGRMRLELVWT